MYIHFIQSRMKILKTACRVISMKRGSPNLPTENHIDKESRSFIKIVINYLLCTQPCSINNHSKVICCFSGKCWLLSTSNYWVWGIFSNWVLMKVITKGTSIYSVTRFSRCCPLSLHNAKLYKLLRKIHDNVYPLMYYVIYGCTPNEPSIFFSFLKTGEGIFFLKKK